MVFTTRLAGGKGGRNAFEADLVRLGITQKNSRPNHPTTCGKVERFQQTLKAWLRAQPTSPPPSPSSKPSSTSSSTSTTTSDPTDRSPTASPPPSPTPPDPKPPPATAAATPTAASATTASTRPGESPCATTAASTTSASATNTPEPASCILVADLDVRVIDAATGELLRHLTLDPNRDYQPLGRPPGPPTRKPQQPAPS